MRGGYNDDAIEVREELHDAEGFVAGAGGKVNDEVVEISPVDFGEEFTDDAHFEGPAPDDRSISGLEEELHGDSENVERPEDRFQSGVTTDHAGAFEAEHFGDVGSSDVSVEDADNVTLPSEGSGEVDCNSSFTNATFTRENNDFMFDVSHLFSDFLFCACLGADHKIFGDFT